MVEDREISAAKFMLAINSDVFERMFNGEWLDTKSDRIVIDDIDYDTMKCLVKAMYTGW